MTHQEGNRRFRVRELGVLGLVLGMLATTNLSAAPAACTPGSCDDNDPCTVDTCDPVAGCIYTPNSCDDGNACTVDSCSPLPGPGPATLFIGHDISQLERQYNKIGSFVGTWGAIGQATGTAVDASGVVYICNPGFGNNVIERRGPGNINLGTITATVNGQWIEDMGNYVPGYILAGTDVGNVFTIDTTTGAHVFLFATGHTIIGVTYDGTHIWTTGGTFNTIVYKRNLAGTVITSFNTGQTNTGIGYDPDDGTLWIGHPNAQVTHHTQLGALLGGFTTLPGGFFIDGVELGIIPLEEGCRNIPLVCNDNDFCTMDACDPVTGCFNPPRVCDDGNPCTDDVCDSVAGCVFTNNTDPCDDSNFCTNGDTCAGGLCIAGPPLVCNDNNVCTTDNCDARFGCDFVNNTNLCDDGNACTFEEMCAGGICQPGLPLGCDDGNVCTTDSCDPMTGCVFTNTIGPCDDGNACSTGEICVGGTCQLGIGLACNPSDQCHVAGVCDPLTGICSNPLAPNGTVCNDGNPCTFGEVCVSGVCGGATTITIPVATQNLSAAADKTTYTWTPVPDATSYAVVRGDTAALPVGSSAGGEVCFAGFSAPAVVDTATPAPGAAFWYLSQARNPCGHGPIGIQSNGTARVTTICP